MGLIALHEVVSPLRERYGSVPGVVMTEIVIVTAMFVVSISKVLCLVLW